MGILIDGASINSVRIGEGGVNPSGGSGGPLTDVKSQSFSWGEYTSPFHRWASHVDNSQTVRLMVWFHGDGYYEFTNPEASEYIGGTNGLLAVARKQNAVLVVPRTPDASGGTWWEWAGPDDLSGYAAALINTHISQYNVDRNRVIFAGFSGGAEFLSCNLLRDCGASLNVTGGGQVIIGGGTPATGKNLPSSLPMEGRWFTSFIVGENDTAANSDEGFDAVQAATKGQAWWQAQGWQATLDIIPGYGHLMSGLYGGHVSSKLAANPPIPGRAVAISEVYFGADLVWQNVPKVTITKISDVWMLLGSPEHLVYSNGQYRNASDQLVSGVPNWNDWAIPEVPFRIVLAPTFTAGAGMFSSRTLANCRLVTAPKMDTRYLTDMTAFFWNSANLENIPDYTITACTSIKDFVANCPKVKSAVLRDCGNVQNVRNAFGSGSETMPACTRVELHGLGPSLPNGHILDLSKTALTAAGATALFNSLGTVTSGRTATLKLPDSALGARQGVARSKGWTVTPVVDEVVITGTSGTQARDSFRAALTSRGLDYKTVKTVPFLLDTSQVTNMSNMFSGCSSLTSVPNMNTANVKDMFQMFNGCSSLTSVPNMNTANVKDMSSMFNSCSSLTSVPDMNTANVKDMSFMFYNCAALTSVPNIDTSNVTIMSSVFSGCLSLTSVPDMNTSNATNMSFMFSGCAALTSVPDMNTSNVTRTSSMFQNCTALTDGNVRCIGKKSGVITNSMIDGSGLTRLPFYDTNGNWTG